MKESHVLKNTMLDNFITTISLKKEDDTKLIRLLQMRDHAAGVSVRM